MAREIPAYCKIINPRILKAIGGTIDKEFQHGDKEIARILDNELLGHIIDDCHWEEQNGEWIQFPKREEAKKKVCAPHGCNIAEIHGDGDMTIEAGDSVYVITTDGRIFKEVQQEEIE